MEFTYEALNSSGIRLQERVEASDEDEALSMLHGRGLVVLAL